MNMIRLAHEDRKWRMLSIVRDFTKRVAKDQVWKDTCTSKALELFLAYEGEEHHKPDISVGCELTNALAVAALLVHHVGAGTHSDKVKGWTDCDARRKLQEAMAHLSAGFVKDNPKAACHLAEFVTKAFDEVHTFTHCSLTVHSLFTDCVTVGGDVLLAAQEDHGLRLCAARDCHTVALRPRQL